MGKISGGCLVARALRAEGVKYIFSLCGGSILPVYEGCLGEDIQIIDFRHEQSAAFAAAGWAKVTGTPGVVVATGGPGVSNLPTAIASAFNDGVPVISIGGRTAFTNWDKSPPQELDQVGLMSPITKWSRTVLETNRIPEYISMAFRQAIGPASGPVFLEIPENIMKAEIEESDVEFPTKYRPTAGPQGDPGLVMEATKLLSRAKTPVVVAGPGIWWSQSYRELQRLISLNNLPVFLVGMGRGCVPYGDKHLFNYARRFALTQADVVVFLGVPIDFRLGYGRPPMFDEKVKVIQVDFESENIGYNRPVDVGIYGNIKAILKQLIRQTDRSGFASRDKWIEKISAEEFGQEKAQEALLDSDSVPIHPLRLCKEIRDFADKDTTIIGDGGDFVSYAARVLRVYQPGHWLDPGSFGALGCGAGGAIAAKLARPDKKVLILNGDGAFALSAMEFDTMVKNKLPVISIIGNNTIWGQVKANFLQDGKTPIATDLSPTARYDKVVEALGGYGELVEKPEDIRPALERAADSGLPACLNVMTSPDVFYGARSYKGPKK